MKIVKLLLAIVVCGGMMFLATNVVFDLTFSVNTYIRHMLPSPLGAYASIVWAAYLVPAGYKLYAKANTQHLSQDFGIAAPFASFVSGKVQDNIWCRGGTCVGTGARDSLYMDGPIDENGSA